MSWEPVRNPGGNPPGIFLIRELACVVHSAMSALIYRVGRRSVIPATGRPLSRGFAKAVSSDEEKAAAADVGQLIARSRAAQAQIENYSQEQVDRMIKAIVWSVCRPGTAEKIAQFTVDESRLGNYEGKYLKMFKKTRATLLDIIND